MSWETQQLGELCEFKGGLWTGKKPPFTKAKVLRITNFTKSCELDVTDAIELDVEERQLQSRRLVDGDIIIEKSGGGPNQPVGRVALCADLDGVYSFSNFTTALRINDRRKLEPKFLHQYLKALYFRGDTEAMQSNSTNLRNLNLDAYRAIDVPLPPLPEQQRIVGKLDAAFAALTEAQAHVERNRANARELFESYLNGVFTPDSRTNAELRMLGEIVDFEGGSQPPKSEFIYEPRAGYVRFLQIRDFKRDDKVTFIPIAKKNRTCEENDVLIGRYGASVGNILSGRAGAYNVALVKTKPSKAITRDYLYYYLLSHLFQDALKKVADRSAQDGFSKDDIYNFPVPLPSIAEQDILCKKFNEVLRESNELERTYHQKQTELAGLKKAVLGVAFRGEL